MVALMLLAPLVGQGIGVVRDLSILSFTAQVVLVKLFPSSVMRQLASLCKVYPTNVRNGHDLEDH